MRNLPDVLRALLSWKGGATLGHEYAVKALRSGAESTPSHVPMRFSGLEHRLVAASSHFGFSDRLFSSEVRDDEREGCFGRWCRRTLGRE